MANTGEVMIPREKERRKGWILPMIRTVEELGGAATWDVEEFKIAPRRKSGQSKEPC